MTRSLGAVDGRELIAALAAGGFRVVRRERGLALLVRALDAVVVPEERVLDATRVEGILTRARVTETEAHTWLAGVRGQPSASNYGSGFRKRTRSEPPPAGREARSFEAVVQNAKEAKERADAAHVDANEALATSRALLAHLRPIPMPDSERVRAVRAALATWTEALRDHEERDVVEGRRRKG